MFNYTSTNNPGSQNSNRTVQNESRSQVNPLKITGSSKTPEVVFDPSANTFSMGGRSLPEDAVGFYSRIREWLEQFHQNHDFSSPVTFRMELEYFNTSSSKCLLDVFKQIDQMYQDGKNVSILWCFDEDDEDMEETGEDYQDLLSVPFTLEAIEY